MTIQSLAHTKWNCKYSYSICTKVQKKSIFGQKRFEIGGIIRELCRWKGVELLSAEACPDHIHILVAIPPKMSVSSFMGFLKGKSSLMIYEKWGNMKIQISKPTNFWCRGYYVDTVGKNEKKNSGVIISNQLKQDEMSEQLVLDFQDRLTGSQYRLQMTDRHALPTRSRQHSPYRRKEEPPAKPVGSFCIPSYICTLYRRIYKCL